jgi:hypothetical protein
VENWREMRWGIRLLVEPVEEDVSVAIFRGEGLCG